MGVAEEEGEEVIDRNPLHIHEQDTELLHNLLRENAELKQEIKRLQGNFSHFHVDNEMNELCALCGLAVINPVHLRSR